MPDYIAISNSEPRLRAWLLPDHPDDDLSAPLPGENGWRVVIETVDEQVRFEPLRSTWEPTLDRALAHLHEYWSEPPVWRTHPEGERVEV